MSEPLARSAAPIVDATAEHELFVSMGPQHPSTHGVLRVLLRLDGERVVAADGDVGYLHRCFEKIAEKRSIHQVIPYTDRTDYLSAMIDEHCFCLACERLMGVSVPERAEFIRVVVGELQRLASHLLFFGTFALDLGAVSAFLYGFREREQILDIFEKLTGARLLYNYLRVGGVRNDLYPGFTDEVRRFLDDFDHKLDEYDDLLTKNTIFEKRTKGIGRLDQETALAYGATGPVLRSTGYDYDVRKADPYSIYERFDFAVPLGQNGDIFDRYWLRMLEMRESVKILRQALAGLPKGDVLGDVPRRIKLEGETYARVESPRGEVGCYLVGDGSDQPYRCHWRSPCFIHLQLLDPLAKGGLMGDMVAVIGSLDIVMGEVDR